MKKLGHYFVRSWRIFMILLLCYCCGTLFAAEKVLRAGITLYEPYVIQTESGYQGIIIDLWSLVAKELSLKYELIPLGKNINQNVEMVKDGKIDILLGPVTNDYTRALSVEFSRPYALNKIGVIVPVVEQSFISVLWYLFVKIFSWAVIIGFILVLIYVHVIWFLERGRLPSVSPNYWQAIRSLLWNTLLKKKGIMDIPSTFPGRITQFIWVSLGTIMLSIIYAAMTTSFHYTFGQINSFNTLDDLSDKRILAVEGNVGYTYATEQGLFVTPVKDRETAMNLLLKEKADGFVDSSAEAELYIKKNNLEKELGFAPFTLKVSILAFALPKRSPLIPRIDAKLAFFEDNLTLMNICKKYMGDEGAKTYCL